MSMPRAMRWLEKKKRYRMTGTMMSAVPIPGMSAAIMATVPHNTGFGHSEQRKSRYPERTPCIMLTMRLPEMTERIAWVSFTRIWLLVRIEQWAECDEFGA